MPLRVLQADLFSVKSEALLLTIDGARRSLEGNLARQFARLYPDDWEDVEAQARYPLPLGHAMCVRTHVDCPWRAVVVASTLHHLDVLADSEKVLVVRRAFADSIALCARHGLGSMASAIMRGGWRLPLQDAIAAMADGWLSSSVVARQLDVTVCCTSAEEAKLANDVLLLRRLA